VWWSYSNRNKARRLRTIAKWINDNFDHKAVIKKGYCNTDRTPRGFMYITHKGKGRRGNLLEVANPEGKIVFKHNSAETYRMNYEVEDWIETYFKIKTIDNDCNTNFSPYWDRDRKKEVK